MSGADLLIDHKAWRRGEHGCDLRKRPRVGLPDALMLGEAELHRNTHLRG
jgi:hypothetical protein